MAIGFPTVPETVTVHLGASTDASAENVTVSFPDYIKNVASSELFPTWPETSLRANIYAIVSFTLNRIYTEFYRSRGYDFDITNNTAEDQSFIRGRDFFDTIEAIVDELFNDYIVRRGNVEPLFAAYCNGTTTVCDGLSQWGSVDLSNQGLGSYDILTFYYGDDIDLVTNAPIQNIEPSDPERVLRIGSYGDDVRFVQLRLNRISLNYPSIPKINPVSLSYDLATENAVKAFQQIFGLTVDGLVGKATWYKIEFIYNAIKRLNEVTGEGLQPDDVEPQLPEALRPGDSGDNVGFIQYFLSVIGLYYDELPTIEITRFYGEETTAAVTAFQRAFGLPVTGIVDDDTGYAIYDTYLGIVISLENLSGTAQEPFGGEFLTIGSTGEAVTNLQIYLNRIATVYTTIAPPEVTGVYGISTQSAVREFQRLFGITQTGIIGPVTWKTITEQYVLITDGETASAQQYKGELPPESEE